MARSSTQVQGPASRDVESGSVGGPNALPLSSALQQPRLQRSPSQQLLLQRFDSEVYPPVETKLALYDARERELETKYRQDVADHQARANKHRTLQAQGEGQQLGPLPPDCLDADEDCYKEIENLVLIERSLIHSKALEEWDRKEKLFTSRVDRKSKKVGNLKNEVYQLIGFFSVFQGVVLTAVAQSNLLHCNNWWSPVGLSVLASVVTIAGVAQKLLQISSLQTTISSEQSSLQEAVRRGQLLRRFGKAFVFMQLGKGSVGPEKEHSRWYNRYTTPYTVVVLLFLLLFTLGFPLSHWRILCHPGHSPSC